MATREVSTRPHRSRGRPTTIPAPSEPPAALTALWVSRSGRATAELSHVPKYPPTSTAWQPSASTPVIASTSSTVFPVSTSSTRPFASGPATLSSWVPGSSGSPTSRNHAAPQRAIRPRWARVSTLLIRVGRLATPLLVRARRREHRLGRASVEEVDERGLLAGDVPPGDAVQLHRYAVEARGRRSAMARLALGMRRPPAWTTRCTLSAATAVAAVCSPSRTRWGERSSNRASLALAGSPSQPLPTTTAGPVPAATARILRPVGKPAPPRPTSPLASTSPRIRAGLCGGSAPYRAGARRGSSPPA